MKGFTVWKQYMLAEPYSVQQRGALNLKVQTYKNMELFIKVDEYSQISCTQPGLLHPFALPPPLPPPPPPKKNAKSLGKVATYESQQAATAIRSDTSGPGCLKGG